MTEKKLKLSLERKKKNEQIKGLISNIYGWVFVTQYNSSLSSFVPNFRALSEVVTEKSLTERKIYIGERKKKNEQIKGLINNIWLGFCYTIQLITIKLCTRFQSPSEVVAEKSVTEKKLKFSLERKKKNEQIKGLISNIWLGFCYTIQLITIKLCTKFQSPK